MGGDPSTRVVVIGASGRVGSAVMSYLSRRGVSVRALTRWPDKQAVVPGVEWVHADLDDAPSLPRVLRGGRELFLLTSPDDRMVTLQTNAIKAAAAAGIEHVVKQSALGASDHTQSRIARWHYEVEQVLMASGLAWTILRPHYFMDNFLAEAEALRASSELRSPVGAGRVPFIASSDIGAVASEVLATSQYRGEKLVLTGGAALSYVEVATEMSEVFGRTIRYREESLDEARLRLASRGAPAWETESAIALWSYQRSGGATASISPNVQRILGREPTSLRRFLEDHVKEFGF